MSLTPDPSLLERNLRVLSRTSPRAALALRGAEPRRDLAFLETEEGLPTCRLGVEGRTQMLASARKPWREAQRLAEQADPAQAAIFAVVGFGLGYHVEAIAQRVGSAGLVLCYEPDLGLLRAVMEHVDCTGCFETGRVVVLHEAVSSDAISGHLHGLEGVLALGVRFISHPASTGRLGESAQQFAKTLVDVVSAAKTSIVTVLMQTEKTIENTLANALAYAAHPGLNDLEGALSGVPAVVISAGPSLAESFDALSQPGLRDRACLIAAQTVLRPLLDRGIRPHFVTALDHHEISGRFYEGLTREGVEGITLVAEPKANPAILDAWPGAVRLVGDGVLDRVLGDNRHASLRSGTTVAHLSYYLARHMGCDPVVLVGQDLAYTDGLYYGAGAAIHNQWSAELGEFRTLEMMETERLGRGKRMLRQTVDLDGRPVATDEQLHTYRLQFERDFADDHARGLMVIDAGRGAAKAHTTAMPLESAIERYGRTFELPAAEPPQDAEAHVQRRLRETARQATELAGLTRRTESLVRGLDPTGEVSKMNAQVRQIHELRDKAEALDPAYWLTQYLNQTGGLRRAKRDRAIALQANEDERELQAQRIERDADNLAWLADAADRLAQLLEASAGHPVRAKRATVRPVASLRLPAVVWFDPLRGGLNQQRDLLRPAVGDSTMVDVLLRTLSRCKRVSKVVLIATDEQAAHNAALGAPQGMEVLVRRASTNLGERRRAIGAARAFSPASFRGGLASLTPHDEAFDPAATLALIEELDAPGVLVLGADWALLDPGLTDAAAERVLVDIESRHVGFVQAPAGLAALALARPAVEEIARHLDAGPAATIGGLLAYLPHIPRPDPIARDICVTVDPALRDLGRRLIPDSGDRLATLRSALRHAADGQSLVEILPSLLSDMPQRPTHLRVVMGEGPDEDLRERVLAFVRGAADAALTIDVSQSGFDDAADDIVRALAGQGAGAIHVRTPLAWGSGEADRLLASRVDVISVDVTDPNFPPPIELLPDGAGRELGAPWVVPRLGRNAAMLPTLLAQYDAALARYGTAVIEPVEQDGPLVALPLPHSARVRLDRETRQTQASSVAPGTVVA